MREEILHYVWKHSLMAGNVLKTVKGEPIHILRNGLHNHQEGPDFLNAQIRIGGTLWAGHVEIHILASDWMRHEHDENPLYNNVILHVVYENDKALDHLNIPVLEIKSLLPKALLEKYESLMLSHFDIPCTPHFSKVPSLHKNAWWTTCMANRWERKTNEWKAIAGSNDWLTILVQQLATHFGFKYNNDAFLKLIQSIPLNILQKHQTNLLHLEALLFGQSGLLPDSSTNEYILSLIKEYHFMRRKYALVPIDEREWKFMRLRPVNFPTVRMAQLAMFLHHYLDELPTIMQFKSWKEFEKLLPVGTSPFWDEYYHFNKKSTAKRKKHLGKSALQNLIINVFAPMQYLYESHYHTDASIAHAIEILESLPKENNHIIAKWEAIGQTATNAFESQALIEAYNQFCKTKSCAQCGIGHRILTE